MRIFPLSQTHKAKSFSDDPFSGHFCVQLILPSGDRLPSPRSDLNFHSRTPVAGNTIVNRNKQLPGMSEGSKKRTFAGELCTK